MRKKKMAKRKGQKMVRSGRDEEDTDNREGQRELQKKS